MFSACVCRPKEEQDEEAGPQVMADTSDGALKCPYAAGAKGAAAPQGKCPYSAGANEAQRMAEMPAIKPRPEDRMCPMTGAIGHCPMAKPKGGPIPKDKLPELKVMMLLVWEKGESKVSCGVYPHMTKHWAALELPDTSSKDQIKAQFRKLSLKYHPDKNQEPSAVERFKEINEANDALREVDGQLAFPWGRNPDQEHTSNGMEALKLFGPLANESSFTDPIKAQMMQHVVKEATDCKTIIVERETEQGGKCISETWADCLCTDERNGSNHLIKVYRRIVEEAPSTFMGA